MCIQQVKEDQVVHGAFKILEFHPKVEHPQLFGCVPDLEKEHLNESRGRFLFFFFEMTPMLSIAPISIMQHNACKLQTESALDLVFFHLLLLPLPQNIIILCKKGGIRYEFISSLCCQMYCFLSLGGSIMF